MDEESNKNLNVLVQDVKANDILKNTEYGFIFLSKLVNVESESKEIESNRQSPESVESNTTHILNISEGT